MLDNIREEVDQSMSDKSAKYEMRLQTKELISGNIGSWPTNS